MKIYVCWDTRASYPVAGDHPCGVAYHAVVDAGYDPEVVKARGWKRLPGFMNRTQGRQEVLEMTGKLDVPVLVLDDGTVIDGSQEIVEWAKQNPASAAA